jgi:voltage-gated potassium channel Kch
MNALLTRLGVPPEIQAFFNASAELSFNYGDTNEHYGDGIHKVPTTQNLWVAGNETASNVIITYSAMEAIAFITINRQRYPNLEQLAFIAIGNKLQPEQVNWIMQNFHKRRFTLVFGKDLIGHITDIKLAAGLKNITIRVFHANHTVMIYRYDELRFFEDERLSLHAFQQAFGLRGRICTRKPIKTLTFLDQLKHDAHR